MARDLNIASPLEGTRNLPDLPKYEPAKTTANVKVDLANIISGEKKKKQKTTTNQATLINPQTGDRKVTEVNSQEAQNLFGQGYVLEESPGVPLSSSQQTTTQEPPSRLETLQGQQTQTRQEMFEAAWNIPDRWSNLSPTEQRALRQERVRDLSSELNNLNAAITQAEKEEEQMEDDAISKLETYLENGVFDLLSQPEKEELANKTGYNVDALEAMNARKDVQFQQLGSSLYLVEYDDEGNPTLNLVAGSPTGGGAAGGGEDIDGLSMTGIAETYALQLTNPDLSNSQEEIILKHLADDPELNAMVQQLINFNIAESTDEQEEAQKLQEETQKLQDDSEIPLSILGKNDDQDMLKSPWVLDKEKRKKEELSRQLGPLTEGYGYIDPETGEFKYL